MNKCRICLENKRTLCSVFDTDQGLSYASMIILVSGIKIVKDEYALICLVCRRKLKDFCEFKLLIERSDLELNKQSKIFKFNTIHDIKEEFLSNVLSKETVNVALDYSNLFQNENHCIYYNDTLIRRLYEEEKKTIPIEELAHTIKSEELENDLYMMMDDFTQEEEYNFKRKKKKSLLSQKNKTSKNTREIFKRANNICIKPIYLSDVRVLKASPNIVHKRRKRSHKSKSDGTLCPFCGKLTKSINTHILTHSGDKKFKCNKCLKTFYSKNSLQNHMKSHLTIQQTFKCEHCIATFSSRGAVVRHMATHMEYKQFSCAICKKEYKWKSGLRRHMFIHDMAAKSIQCNICKMTFYNQSSLKSHSRVHTGERPYKCELCSQPYSYKRDFNRHCLKKHGVVVDRRPVYVMNEDVLKREKALMKDLMLSLHGIPTETEPMDSFRGPQKALAFAKAVKVMQNGQIPIDVQL